MNEFRFYGTRVPEQPLDLGDELPGPPAGAALRALLSGNAAARTAIRSEN
jgi:hypothetical protein